MPDLDELLDADARSWQADIDRRTRAFAEPRPSHRVRTLAWSAAAVAAVAVTSFVIASAINEPGTGGGGGNVTQGSNASCVAPLLTVTPRVVSRGGAVTVRGEWFADGCNDTSESTPVRVMADVPILLIEGTSVRQLATAHPAGARYSFVIIVRIPADAGVGRAMIGYMRQRDASPLNHNIIRITR